MHCCAATCLANLLEHGCPVDDIVFETAIRLGQWESFLVLLDHGLPRRVPYFYKQMYHGNRIGTVQLRCFKHLLDRGCRIDPETLIWAASNGVVDFVRLLHSRGVPLWDRAWEIPDRSNISEDLSFDWLKHCLQERILPIPESRVYCTRIWKALRYGSCKGAPVTPLVEEMFAAERKALLLSFHVAPRLSEGEGQPKGNKVTWAVMGRVPPELVHALVHADLDIAEAFQQSLFRQPSVLVQPGEAESGCPKGVKEYVIPASLNA
jgi:hypothetical protein